MSKPDAVSFLEAFLSRDPRWHDRSHLSDTTQDEIDSKYNIDFPEKGKCLIINMENFSNGLLPRPGTDKDANSLQEVFGKIGFAVQIEKDITQNQYNTVVQKVAREDHSKRGGFVCVILSHGELNGFYVKDALIKYDNLFNNFKGDGCKTLVGKPKLFFIQACRGGQIDHGAIVCSKEAEENVTIIPKEADNLYHYSTPPGYLAWRSPVNGSWFIQTLCEMLKKYWMEYELLQILTYVNKSVAYQCQTPTGGKQMPYMVSTLTKRLFL
ncbi:caspase-3-like [Hyperolius riggenbachi]|uniref:caspase-3-like n=1 Tax=Hyperolius riggenbachi TaxID=752182 RepID=UPI0035A2D8A2